MITDINLPKLDGLELTLPPFLLKPFSIGTLVVAVAGLLAASHKGEHLT